MPSYEARRLSYSGLTITCENGKEMSRACDVCAGRLSQATDPDMVSYGGEQMAGVDHDSSADDEVVAHRGPLQRCGQ